MPALRQPSATRVQHHVETPPNRLLTSDTDSLGHLQRSVKTRYSLNGEQLPEATFRKARQWITQYDLIIIIGSSLEDHPVGHLPVTALEKCPDLIIINQESGLLDGKASVVIRQDAVILRTIAAEVLDEQ